MSLENSASESGNVDELLMYLKNISSFEKDFSRSEKATVGMIWGLTMIFTGFMDLYVALYSHYSPHFLVWVLGLILAYIIQEIVASQPLLFDLPEENLVSRANSNVADWILTAILMLGTIVISFIPEIGLKLVMPYVGIAFGSVTYYFQTKEYKRRILTGEIHKSLIHFVPKELKLTMIVFYGSALINLIGAFFIPGYEIFPGFVFGVSIGGLSFWMAYKSRKLISID